MFSKCIPAYAEGPVQVPLLTVKPSKPQAVTWSDFHSTFLCERFYNLCEKESGDSQFCHYRQIYKTHTSFLYGQLHFQVNVFWHKQSSNSCQLNRENVKAWKEKKDLMDQKYVAVFQRFILSTYCTCLWLPCSLSENCVHPVMFPVWVFVTGSFQPKTPLFLKGMLLAIIHWWIQPVCWLMQCVLLLNNSYTPNDSRSALLCLALFAAMYWRGSLNLRMNLEEMNVQKWKPLHCTLEKLQKLNYLMRVNSTYNNLALNKWWRSLLSSSNHQTIRKQSDAKTNLWAVLTMCQHKAKHWVSAIKWVLMRS